MTRRSTDRTPGDATGDATGRADDAIGREARAVYGDRGDAVADALRALAARFRASADHEPVPPARRMTEDDSILITYPGAIRRPDEAPLRTLGSWLRGPLANTVSTVHLLPFYPWSSDDGFAVKDYRAVAPQYGSWDDVHALRNDHRLMVDAVVNHASAQGDWFDRFLRDEAPYRDWFRTEAPDADVAATVRPRTTPLLTPFETAAGRRWAWTTFGPDQVDLDYREPSLLLEIAGVLLAYVGHGAEVLRMDAVTYLWKELGTPSVHHPKTHGLLRLMRAVLEEAAPWVVLLTETNVPHAENVSYFGDGRDEAQMVYNFALPPLMLHTVASGDATVLRDWAGTLGTPSDQTWFLNFLASHDGIGVRPVEALLPRSAVDALVDRTRKQGGGLGRKRNADGTESTYELNVNYFDALCDPDHEERLDRQVDRFAAAHAVMAALPGVPSVYLHSLLGSRGSPELAARHGVPRAVNRAQLDSETLSRELADPRGRRARVLAAIRALLRARRGRPAFHPSAPSTVLDAPPGVFAVRRGVEERTVTCIQELAGRDATVRVQRGGRELLSGRQIEPGTVPVRPYQVLWIDDTG
ncbi:MAG: alpha-amylase family glycosyl hydrolase [Trueperaceae bacterium]|nr:alpha-amylase family glycosyl hydrolase [Trueperaceae bacterium]